MQETPTTPSPECAHADTADRILAHAAVSVGGVKAAGARAEVKRLRAMLIDHTSELISAVAGTRCHYPSDFSDADLAAELTRLVGWVNSYRKESALACWTPATKDLTALIGQRVDIRMLSGNASEDESGILTLPEVTEESRERGIDNTQYIHIDGTAFHRSNFYIRKATSMSVSIHFQAIIPVDGDTYRKHKAVVDACKAAGVPVPAESAAFFDNGGRDCDREVTERGVLVSIDYGRVRAVEGNVMDGPEAIIDLSKLPPGTTKIRVYAC